MLADGHNPPWYGGMKPSHFDIIRHRVIVNHPGCTQIVKTVLPGITIAFTERFKGNPFSRGSQTFYSVTMILNINFIRSYSLSL